MNFMSKTVRISIDYDKLSYNTYRAFLIDYVTKRHLGIFANPYTCIQEICGEIKKEENVNIEFDRSIKNFILDYYTLAPDNYTGIEAAIYKSLYNYSKDFPKELQNVWYIPGIEK